jgi:hypothetical protein
MLRGSSYIPLTGTFNTLDVRPYRMQHTPETSKAIAFSKPFFPSPGLSLGLNYLDLGNESNVRIKAYASDITSDGFRVHVDSWSDTTLHAGGASWFNLAPDHLEYQHGQFSAPAEAHSRLFSDNITFAPSFVSPPKVIVFFNTLDLDKETSWRIKTYATNISSTGFTIHIESWHSTVAYGAAAGWIAYPENLTHVFSGTSNTMEVCSKVAPQHMVNKRITFDGIEFHEQPNVFMAINYIDVYNSNYLRLRAFPSSITTTGMDWNIESWISPNIHHAGISYICVTTPPAA